VVYFVSLQQDLSIMNSELIMKMVIMD